LVLELLQQLECAADVFPRRLERRKSHCKGNVGQSALSDKAGTKPCWGNLPCPRRAGSLRPLP
jgi:hypothetical protein